MKKILEEFKSFAMKGNMMDLAVGMVIGAAFTSIVNSLVNDMIMPLLSIFTKSIDFTNLFLAMDGNHYASLKEAKDLVDGAPATVKEGLSKEESQ